jgi:transposase
MVEGRPSYEELAALVESQARELRELRQRVAELEAKLQEAHRQAAPFRRRPALKRPEAEKKRPGRAPGHPGAHREPPTQVDAVLVEPLEGCPLCRGPVTDVTQRVQFIEEWPEIKPVCVQLTTYVGQCARCGEVQSTHPLQTSTATGAAATHLGPRAQALAVSLVHQSGLSLQKACDTLQQICGLKLTAGGLAQLLQRTARRCGDWFADIVRQLRTSAAVYADETSWYVGRPGWWLWVFTTPRATAYFVEESRGSDVVEQVLTADFPGMLVSDCLASYNAICCRKHKCLAHHLRALKEHEQSLEQRGVKSDYLMLWKFQLKDVIATWHERPKLSEVEFTRKVAQLARGVDHLLGCSPPHPEDVRFRDRLNRQRAHLLGCLSEPAAEPTNNRAERDLRPAVISRKLSCGNRTVAGKTAWEVLRSIAVTTHHRGERLLDALAPRLQLAARLASAGR